MVSDAEIELLRKKVFFARLAVAIVVVLGIVAFVFSKWSGSDSGTVAHVEFQLKHDHSKSTIIESLSSANSMLERGNSSDAQKIEDLVEKALDTEHKSAKDAFSTYLDTASTLKKKGCKLIAAKLALKGAQRLSTDLNKTASPPDFSESLDELASLIEDQSLSAEQAGVLLDLSAKQSPYLLKSGKDRILKIAIAAGQKSGAPLSENWVNCLFARDLMAANRNASSELEKDLQESTAAASKLQDSGTGMLSGSPHPSTLFHYLDLADALSIKAPESARLFLTKADDEISKLDQSTITDEQKQLLAESYRRMSRTFFDLNDKDNAVAKAKLACMTIPLKSATSISCANQLIKVLLSTGKASEAESLAKEAYQLANSSTDLDPQVQTNLRAQCAEQLFDVYVHTKKTSLAVKQLSDEIKRQQKSLPSSAKNVIELTSYLADYYLSKSYFKQAQLCVKQLAELSKTLKGDERLQLDMKVIAYALKSKNPDLANQVSADAIAQISKDKEKLMDPQWIDDFCITLENFRKAEDTEHYNQTMDLIKSGFAQQLDSTSPDPIVLASVVNQLGTTGEEKTADQLRTEALDKLKDPVASVFRSRSMDFVVNGEKENAQYTDPEQSIDVYLDLGSNMLNKDNESASKYAFEAMKISYLLADRRPELLSAFLDRIDEAATIMLSTKQSLNKDQIELIYDLASLESENIRKTSKDHILDLMLSSIAKSDLNLVGANSDNEKSKLDPEVIVRCMILKDELLAKRGQIGQLDAQTARARDLYSKLNKPQTELANHFLSLSELLAERHDAVPARRYAALAARTIEDQVSKDSTSSDKVQVKSVDSSTLAQFFSRISEVYRKAGDNPNAIAFAKKAYGARPLQDPLSAWRGVSLADRLMDAGNFADAETLANELRAYAKSRPLSSDNLNLRVASTRRLYRALNEQHKDQQAGAVLKEELDERQQLASSAENSKNASALQNPNAAQQTAELNSDLATYYLQHQDVANAATCVEQIKSAKTQMTPSQRAVWDRSSRQRDLILQAESVDNAKLASEALSDLMRCADLDRASAIRTPAGWWSASMTYFDKNNGADQKKLLTNFAKGAVLQQLSRADADPKFLGAVVNQISTFGEPKIAIALRNEAERKLSAASKEIFMAQCKDLPATAPAEEAQETKEKPAVPTQAPDSSGRIDTSD